MEAESFGGRFFGSALGALCRASCLVDERRVRTSETESWLSLQGTGGTVELTNQNVVSELVEPLEQVRIVGLQPPLVQSRTIPNLQPPKLHSLFE